MGPFWLAAGVALLGLSAWWRAAPRPGGSGTRWWASSRANTRGALLLTPGIALVLLGAVPLSGYDRDVPDERWRLWFTLLLLVGGVMALWAGLALPIPRWVLPRWLRAARTTGTSPGRSKGTP